MFTINFISIFFIIMTNHIKVLFFFQFDLILKIEFEGKYEYRIFQA